MNALDKFLTAARGYFDLVKEGVVLCDNDCRVRFVNAAACELLQQKPNALTGKKLNTLCSDETVEKLKDRGFNLPKGLVVSFTYKGETVCKTRVIATPLMDESERTGVMLLLRNNNLPFRVTQEQFMERNAALRAIGLLDGQVCAVSDLKTGGHVFVSAAAERFLGWSVSNFLNGGWAFVATICDPEDLLKVRDKMNELLALYQDVNYNEPYEFRYRLRHKDGHWVQFEEKGCVLERDPDNSPRYVLGFIKEITDSSVSHYTRFKLTQRETDIAQRIVRGLSSKEMAEDLGLSVHTVNEVRKHLLQKTDSPNSAALVKALNTPR